MLAILPAAYAVAVGVVALAGLFACKKDEVTPPSEDGSADAADVKGIDAGTIDSGPLDAGNRCSAAENPTLPDLDEDGIVDGAACGDTTRPKWNDEYARLARQCARFVDLDVAHYQNQEWLELLCTDEQGAYAFLRCPAPTLATWMNMVTCDSFPTLPQQFEGSPIRYKHLADIGGGKLLIPWETEAGRSGFSVIDRQTRQVVQEAPLTEFFIPGTNVRIPIRGISGAAVSNDRLILTFTNPNPQQPGTYNIGYVLVFQFDRNRMVRLDDIRFFRTSMKKPVAVGINGTNRIVILNNDPMTPSMDAVNTSTTVENRVNRRTPLPSGRYQEFPELPAQGRFTYTANADRPAALMRVFTSTTATATPQRIDLPSAITGTITDTDMRGNVVVAIETGGRMALVSPRGDGTSFDICTTYAGKEPQAVIGTSSGLVAAAISGAFYQQPGEGPRIAVWYADPKDCR